MNRRTERVFIDTNMLFFATQYRRDDVFSWFNQLYGNIWIHVDVLEEMLEHRNRVLSEINAGRWRLFDPSRMLSSDAQLIYSAQHRAIKAALQKLDTQRAMNGQRIKHTANTGEISTLAVCLTEDARLICSNDFDIRNVVQAEHYTYIADDNSEHLIVQDSAADFCCACVAETTITKSQVRHFFKTIFDHQETRQRELKRLDERLTKI
ncbi:hypothetical protein C6Y11_07495 [Lactiplantibacillus pentosus]|uniref:hypothetical protein n=2 Tax=Lactiplantibacillus pentosus TaxID=1589 RepID=UPI000D0135C2|nr:hypothetical protein [Lactiplantibacillus pentosus]MCT3282400.1 hypothetical protein [Lactiplantibacillus pentosus]MCT3301619.1 hypothetical protein [Lactiplantibacillus pentosus]PRO80117.1 hypothetical protein C6Y11_07495 [Lactiplantibacillus pentosus]PRO82881.1 hypothetical protein C6Y09_03065 [Lactiplantibacillus pentosus]PRO92784.1 hypothetical protein C6Y12_04615 [Lactiplantibacillus pentosus]